MSNLFNAVVFTGNRSIGNNGYVKFRKINDKSKFIYFITARYPKWIFINWTNKKTGSVLTQKR